MANTDAHLLVADSLAEALLQLMEAKPLGDVNISELCARAGVSRVSFYRNYSSKEDILVRYLGRCTYDWWKNFSKKNGEEFYSTFWPELLGQYRKNERLIRLIYDNSADYILKNHIFSCCCSEASEDETDAYARAALAGAIYGLVDEWIKRGMGDMPKDFSLHGMLIQSREETA